MSMFLYSSVCAKIHKQACRSVPRNSRITSSFFFFFFFFFVFTGASRRLVRVCAVLIMTIALVIVIKPPSSFNLKEIMCTIVFLILHFETVLSF